MKPKNRFFVKMVERGCPECGRGAHYAVCWKEGRKTIQDSVATTDEERTIHKAQDLNAAYQLALNDIREGRVK